MHIHISMKQILKFFCKFNFSYCKIKKIKKSSFAYAKLLKGYEGEYKKFLENPTTARRESARLDYVHMEYMHAYNAACSLMKSYRWYDFALDVSFLNVKSVTGLIGRRVLAIGAGISLAEAMLGVSSSILLYPTIALAAIGATRFLFDMDQGAEFNGTEVIEINTFGYRVSTFNNMFREFYFFDPKMLHNRIIEKSYLHEMIRLNRELRWNLPLSQYGLSIKWERVEKIFYLLLEEQAIWLLTKGEDSVFNDNYLFPVQKENRMTLQIEATTRFGDLASFKGQAPRELHILLLEAIESAGYEKPEMVFETKLSL